MPALFLMKNSLPIMNDIKLNGVLKGLAFEDTKLISSRYQEIMVKA